jgi:hypothetical protein
VFGELSEKPAIFDSIDATYTEQIVGRSDFLGDRAWSLGIPRGRFWRISIAITRSIQVMSIGSIADRFRRLWWEDRGLDSVGGFAGKNIPQPGQLMHF